MENKVDFLIERITDKEEQEAFKYAEELAAIATEEVHARLLELLQHEDWEISYLAAKALGKMGHQQETLDALFTMIHDGENRSRAGELVEALEGFDLSDHFVDVLRIYLFGNYKASMLAKTYLDHTEFEITPRVIKKSQKHWKHYQNNVKQDDAYQVKEREVEAIFSDLNQLFSE